MILKMMGKVRKIIQKILITVFLLFIYIFGFGITVFLAAIFNRRLLKGQDKKAETFWQKAEGYEPDMTELMRQS